ncbi:Phospholipid:diacylglycerol acyltransferase [Termitomyces sp. J132]|nr:Phospholipid:diacylglycerol acyltransferase [Termitomyces sp. J132]
MLAPLSWNGSCFGRDRAQRHSGHPCAYLPGFDLTRVEAEWSRFRNSIPEIWKFNNDGREFQVGDAMKARGLSATHPVILIPGVISTGLESWSTSPDYRAFFREKLWGGFNMISQVTFNKEKWISAMMLDPVTGLDPPNVKIRAAEGIDAASSFVQGYWIWSKIVENLAVVNYDTNNLYLAPYDWRLSYYNLEERDGYFSRLKTTIETEPFQTTSTTLQRLRESLQCLAVQVLLYFFKWVESPLHGGGGPRWVENHIEAYISIAGTHLGVVRIFRLISASLVLFCYLCHGHFPLTLYCGGNAIWGNDTHAPDDQLDAAHTHGELIAFKQAQEFSLTAHLKMTAEQAGTWILEQTPSTFQKMIATNYSFGLERDETVLEKNNLDPTKWTNPLEVRLPNAPSMKLYCVYGHGKETERSYWYRRGDHSRDDITQDDVEQVCRDSSSSDCVDNHRLFNIPSAKQTCIDATFTNDTMIPKNVDPITRKSHQKCVGKVRNGIKMGEGDGTVSLLSLGAMCAEGWKRPRWNPGGIKVVTVELPHRPIASIPRGGANTSDHVDILGSTGLNEIILKVATGVGHEITENYVSNIREYAKKIEWD